ncbi:MULTISPECIES: hypothetical protein [Listeria]|uniref:hypothetical protein n=1 Tax=Listeria TaxID=1637 RepID=UPI000B597742|nr:MULTISPECIES: hypothetical protein [Listeria]
MEIQLKSIKHTLYFRLLFILVLLSPWIFGFSQKQGQLAILFMASVYCASKALKSLILNPDEINDESAAKQKISTLEFIIYTAFIIYIFILFCTKFLTI